VDELGKYLESISPQNLILWGDLNRAGKDIDRTGGQNRTDRDNNIKMNDILDTHKMIDIYRRFNMLRREYTYHYTGNMAIRIDTFFGTLLGTNYYINAGISEIQISDHKLVFLEFKQNKRIKWGRGLWKLNNTF
jgi:exonuclease III